MKHKDHSNSSLFPFFGISDERWWTWTSNCLHKCCLTCWAFPPFLFFFSLCTDQLSKRFEYKGWFGILKRCKLNEQSRSITQWLHDQAPGSPVQVNCSLMGQHVGLFIGKNCSLGPGKKLDFLIIWFDSLGALISMQKGNSDKLEHEIGTPQIGDCLYWSCAALSWSTDLQPLESSLCKDQNTQSILPKSKNRE